MKVPFFVNALDADPVHFVLESSSFECGRRVEVTFLDGEVLSGTTLNYSLDAAGFFVTPVNGTGNNLLIFVASGAVRHVKFP